MPRNSSYGRGNLQRGGIKASDKIEREVPVEGEDEEEEGQERDVRLHRHEEEEEGGEEGRKVTARDRIDLIP